MVLLASCSSQHEKLIIACASNLETPIDSVARIFQEQTGNQFEIITGASGTLATQIEAGAPYDIFISADAVWTEHLFRKELCSKPHTFASGHLIIVYKALEGFSFSNPDSLLLSDKIEKIGLADPNVAPYGKAAWAYLESHDILEQIKHKLVYGEHIGQVNNYMQSGAVELAFVSNSFVHEMSSEEFAVFRIGPDSLSKKLLEHSIVNVKHEQPIRHEAILFNDFIRSEQSSEILKYFGYTVN